MPLFSPLLVFNGSVAVYFIKMLVVDIYADLYYFYLDRVYTKLSNNC